MFSTLRPFRVLSFALLVGALGCHAQVPPQQGKPVAGEVSWRIETLLRTTANLPPGTEIHVGTRTASDLSGYDKVEVTFKLDGETSPPAYFLISSDNKTFAQFNKFDISQDPKQKVSEGDRSPRGGAKDAPVLIVGFDDLECPFCAQLHTQLFPALLQRYGNDIHLVYYDYPLKEIHPWAMRAAVDVNCMANQNGPGYWNLVDYVHSHLADLPADQKSLAKTNEELDRLTREEGQRQKVDMTKLNACIDKQDSAPIEEMRKLGGALGVHATPTLFINGDKIDGALPVEFIYKIIDTALASLGKVPPPPPQAPAATPADTTRPGH